MGKWYQKNKTQLEGLTVGTFGVVSKSGSPGHCRVRLGLCAWDLFGSHTRKEETMTKQKDENI